MGVVGLGYFCELVLVIAVLDPESVDLNLSVELIDEYQSY